MSNSKVEVSKPIIRFTKDTHTYTTDGLPCYSANTVKDYFKDPMDIDYWEYYKALELCVPNFKELKKQRFKYPDIMKPPVWWLDELRGMLPEYMYNSARERIQDLWQASRDDGTEFHDMMEQKMYKDGYAINPWDKKSYPVKRYHKDYDNQSITNDLSTLEDGCYPELLVYMRVGDVMITGQADVVYIDGKYSSIDDFKTNRKFSKSKSKTMYHEPFSHLDTSKFTNYAVQMSIYQYILECSGFIPRNIGLHHYKNYDPKTAKKYDLPYLKDEVKGMIELFAEIHSAK